MRWREGKCIVMFVLSFCITLLALMQIPRLQDYETCLSAAIIITGAYAWFAALIWMNVVVPMIKK